MTNGINLEKLYNGVIDNNCLTTKQLKEYGFSQYDIAKLMDESIITRIKRGYYDFKDINGLIHYGTTLDKKRAYQCFLKCYELDPNNSSICFRVFLGSIMNKDYDKTFETYDVLYNSINEYYNIDFNLYLYLLSFITDIPDKHKTFSKYINFYDLKIPRDDKRYDDNKAYNSIRGSIIKRKFSLAAKQIDEIAQNRGHSTIQDIITTTLLCQVIKAEKKSRKQLFKYISDNDYESIVNHLQEKSKNHKLSKYESSIFMVAKKYLKIKNTLIIPEVNIKEYENIFDAIYNNNFNEALDLCIDFNKEKELKDYDNLLYYILNDINELIENIKGNYNEDSQYNINQTNGLSVNDKTDESLKRKIKMRKEEEIKEQLRKDESDRLLIDRKYDDLLDNRGIILLRPMNDERINKILAFSKIYPNMKAEVITDFGDKKVLLRYKPLISDDINISEVSQDAKQAYTEKDYKSCIESNLKIIETLDYPKSMCYYIIGKCYLNMGEREKAIEYITVANSIAYQNNEKYDYSDVLLSLKSLISKYDFKIKCKMDIDEFDNKTISVDNFDEINDYICESGLDVQSACLQLGLSKDQIDMINLVYAKKFFELDNKEKGMLFLNFVEMSKNKAPEVKKMISEIKKNMKFYKNRKNDDIKQLQYTLKPKK